LNECNDKGCTSFRNTHATTLIENDVTPREVADMLGHSNTNITQNLYTQQLFAVKLYKKNFGNYNYQVFFLQRRDTFDK